MEVQVEIARLLDRGRICQELTGQDGLRSLAEILGTLEHAMEWLERQRSVGCSARAMSCA